MSRRTWATAALVGLLVVGLSACGYRPANAVADDLGQPIHVGAFDSIAAYPELAVYASTALGHRLVARGFSVTSGSDFGQRAEGSILTAGEQALGLQSGEAVSEVVIQLQARLLGPDVTCETPIRSGRAPLYASLGSDAEAARVAAFQAAIDAAVEELVTDLTFCIRELTSPERPQIQE